MKILLSSPYNKEIFERFPGGISVWARNLYTHYQADPRDIELDIFSTTRSKDINERTPKVVRVYEGIKDYGGFLIKTYRKLKSERYDAIHFTSTAAVGLYKDLVTIRVAKICGTKSVVHFHFGRIPELSRTRTKEWRLLCKVVSQADKVIVIDQSSYDTLLDMGYRNVIYLPNPLSHEVVDTVQKYQDEIHRVPRRILFAARVFRQKGIYELVEACTKLSNIQLRVVGNVEEAVKNELYRIANNAEWLEFTGPVRHEEVIVELLACDIHVLPTYNEGFPNAILECMACGAPTITTPVGAIPEMMDFEGEPCGMSIRKQNVDDIVKAIEGLIDNEPQKKIYAERSQKRVAEMYSEESVYEKQYSIWKSLM